MTYDDLVVRTLTTGIDILFIRREAEDPTLAHAEQVGQGGHLALSIAGERVCIGIDVEQSEEVEVGIEGQDGFGVFGEGRGGYGARCREEWARRALAVRIGRMSRARR